MTLTEISNTVKALWPSGIEWMDWERKNRFTFVSWTLRVGIIDDYPPVAIKDIAERIAQEEYIDIVWIE